MTRLCACLALATLAACIKAPEIVLVDRATALEQQAAGSFKELEEKLVRNAIAARPVPLTPAELQALGIRQPPLVDDTELTEADRIDTLLKRRCIGEALDGTLSDTHESCRGASDRGESVTLLEKVNRARQQLWRWMQSRRPQASAEEVRRAWRQAHLKALVCGGWLQKDNGDWEPKKC
jgi:hypothetical protein